MQSTCIVKIVEVMGKSSRNVVNGSHQEEEHIFVLVLIVLPDLWQAVRRRRCVDGVSNNDRHLYHETEHIRPMAITGG